MCSWGGEKVEVLSFGEWERKVEWLSRGERVRRRLVILKRGGPGRLGEEAKKNQREREGSS